MTVSIVYQPYPDGLSFGAYAALTSIMLDGAPANTKYVMQLIHDGNIIADVRQSQNQAGKAVFNVGEILQNYVETNRGANTLSPFVSSPTDIPWGNLCYSTAREEIFPYDIAVGSDDGTTVTIDITYSGLEVWNAIQAIQNMSVGSYGTVSSITNTIATVQSDPESIGCILKPNLNEQGVALTNRPILTLADQFGNPTFKGGIPDNIILSTTGTWLTWGYSIDSPNIDQYLLGKDVDTEGFTLFWRNLYSNLANSYNNSIGGIRFDWYDGETLLGSNIYENTTLNNGGPDSYPKEGLSPAYPYSTVGVRVGTRSVNGQSYKTVTGTTLFTRPTGVTHYYVYPVATQPNECGGDFIGFSNYPSHYPVRVNIREEYFTEYTPAGKGMDLRGCSDYDPVMFRWTNTIGYQDHAWFMKKNTYTKNTKRETFYKDQVDYATDTTDPQYIKASGLDRLVEFNGTQIYNNTVEEVFTATTGWMHDEMAKYLQWMFQSPNVTADGYPVVLVTSSWTEKNFAKDKLYQYEVTYKLASPIKAQNR